MAVILFTDIEGSTSLWSRHARAMRSALARHDELLTAAIADAGGTVFKHTGDGCGAVFPTVAAAAQAASASQAALAGVGWGEVGPLRVRMAIHVGEADQRDGDWFGPALNRCARLMAIGHGGQVLMSGAAQALVAEAPPVGLSLVDLGTHRLRDLSQPEHVWQLELGTTHSPFPPLRSLDSYRGNLPSELSRFIGREREQQDVRQLVQGPERLITLVGPGGMGKTRLALQVAAAMIERFPEGVWFVELAPLGEGPAIEHVTINTVGLQARTGVSPIDVLTDGMHGWKCLLVVDNCEHLIGAVGNLVELLLRRCPSVTVLATSRAPLRVPGERVHQVGPLSFDGDAAALFEDRAGRARPGFVLSPDNHEAVARLCRQLDGMPLAIELAAARMRSMAPSELVDRLGQRFRLLRADRGERLGRHATLEALISWSDSLLSSAQRELLQDLSIFSGGFDLRGAHHIGAKAGADELDTLDALDALVEQSLVQAVELWGGTRYTILETIRQFSLERLDERARQALHQAHAAFILDFVEAAEAGLAGQEQIVWLQRLELEHDNIRSALRWATSPEGDGSIALRLVAALAWFWRFHSHLAEGRRWLEAVLGVAMDGGAVPLDETALVRAHTGAGLLAYAQSDFEAARAAFEAALSWARRIAEPAGAGWALHGLGRVALETDDLVAAAKHLTDSIELFSRGGDERGLAYSWIYLGAVRTRTSDHVVAGELFERAEAPLRARGDSWGLSALLTFSAGPAVARGDLVEGARRYGEALGLYAELGTVWMTAQALLGLANAARLSERWEGSVRLYGAAETLGESLGRPADTGHAAEAKHSRAYAVLGHRSLDAHDRNLDEARERLGAERFERSWSEGRGSTFEAALRGAVAVAADIVASSRDEATEAAPLLDLTPREVEVLRLVGQGCSNKEAARSLGLSVRTVENHLAHIYLKLGVQSRVEAALLANSLSERTAG